MYFRKRHKYEVPQLNTASLPDLIFTVLFFFMMVTHMRSVPVKVEYTVPQGDELTRLSNKAAVLYIYIGARQHPGQSGERDDGTFIQLGDKFATTEEIVDYVSAERKAMSPENRDRMIVSVKADRNTPMGVISEVRQALREANVMHVSFSAVGKNDNLIQK